PLVHGEFAKGAETSEGRHGDRDPDRACNRVVALPRLATGPQLGNQPTDVSSERRQLIMSFCSPSAGATEDALQSRFMTRLLAIRTCRLCYPVPPAGLRRRRRPMFGPQFMELEAGDERKDFGGNQIGCH